MDTNKTQTKTIKLTVSTDQEAFDAVVRHLRKQNRQAFWDGGCVYLADDGRKCAIGCLLADYDKALEGQPITILAYDWGLGDPVRVDVGDVSVEMLAMLQAAHDDSASWSNAEKGAWMSNFGLDRLRKIANTFRLDGSIIDQIFVYKTGNEVSGLRNR